MSALHEVTGPLKNESPTLKEVMCMQVRLKQGILTMVAVLPLAVMARSAPGSSGRPVVWADGGCFYMNGSSMTNICSTVKQFEFPLIMDSSGNKTAVVSAAGPSATNNVGCAAAGVNREGTIGWGGTRKWLESFGSPQLIRLTDAYVPTGGYMYVNCHLDPGSTVISIDYSP